MSIHVNDNGTIKDITAAFQSGLAVPVAGSTTPKAPGTAAVGTSTKYAREDHIHPTQTVPTAATATPKAPGTAAVGTSTKYAREDHVHPVQGAGPVTKKGTRNTNGNWSITGLQVGVPLYIIGSSSISSGQSQFGFRHVSGASGSEIVRTGVDIVQGGDYPKTNVAILIPTNSTVVLNVVHSNTTYTVSAYQ